MVTQFSNSQSCRGAERRSERGISLGLVAISIFALLGVSALLIDVVSLYVARADAQRVANAAALAGAKALVDGGVTANPANIGATWSSACTLASAEVHQIISTSKIGGTSVPSGETVCFGSNVVLPCSSACPTSGSAGSGFGVNPQIGVTLRSATLPLFFSKILGRASATVSAGGVAEGFNSSGTSVPVASRGVMPWLIPNIDPKNGGTIIDSGTGQMILPGSAGFIGEQITLNMGCPVGGCAALTAPNPVVSPTQSTFYPIALANPPTLVPACSISGTDYEMNMVANNPTPVACGATATVETTVSPATPTNQTELNCRIRANPGNGQDKIAPTYPFDILADDNNPLVVNGTVTEGEAITTSPSVVTIPIYDAGVSGGPYLAPVSPVVIIGFVQGFVKSTTAGSPRIQVMNVSGCGTAARGSSHTVGSDGALAVPVRLIHP